MYYILNYAFSIELLQFNIVNFITEHLVSKTLP